MTPVDVEDGLLIKTVQIERSWTVEFPTRQYIAQFGMLLNT